MYQGTPYLYSVGPPVFVYKYSGSPCRPDTIPQPCDRLFSAFVSTVRQMHFNPPAETQERKEEKRHSETTEGRTKERKR